MIPMKKLTRSRAIVLATLIAAASALAIFGSTLLSSDSGAVTSAASQGTVEAADSAVATQAINTLRLANSQIDARVSRKTGVYTLVRAQSGVLATANALFTPEARARTFLSTHGGLFGMSATERALAATSGPASTLQLVRVFNDGVGGTHVKFDQRYQGLNVYGAQVVVHMKSTGITAVSGDYVPAINAGTNPKVTAARAAEVALKQQVGQDPYTVAGSELMIYRTGLLEGARGQSRLAHAVTVTNGKGNRDLIVIDALKGDVLNRIGLNPHAKNRIIYTPVYGDPFAVRHEGDPYTPGNPPGTTGADPINNLYLFAGETYNMFSSAFGRDAYDGAGHTMHSVLLANNQCPNAYWNSVSTNYCPDFDADDVVSHEWGHAYTEHTHGLIYSYQSGALNESYSDIFGESHDLHNGVDAEGGSNNAQPMPNGQRWQMGEDVNGFNQPALGILRDMWDPTRFGQPDKVSSPNYSCGSGDSGGVHANSGVPNHAFAMLVDGKTYNGQNVQAIGFTRALAIYYRAMTVYQGPTSDFQFHALALQASCNDLIGAPLKNLSTSSATGAVSTDVITATTCQQVNKAMLAVEMSSPPPCPITILLEPDAPAACAGAADIFTENWEDGNMDGWTKNSAGTFPEWEDASRPVRDFAIDATPPAPVVGKVASAKAPAVGEPGGGDCTPVAGQDYSGQFSIDSPTITIPAGNDDVKLRFDHYVDSEGGVDGGQVELSVNGGAFQLVSESDYEYNYPKTSYNLPPPAGNNTNPNPGEAAWTGANIGTPASAPRSSWGTTIINLANLTNPGDTVKVRFNWSQDGCNGTDGWYVDNIRVYNCALLEAPTLSLGADYQNPDPNGSYTLNWTRPAGATGPDVLQESSVCAPLLTSDGSSLTGWTAAKDNQFAATWGTDSAKPQHAPNSAFKATPNEQGFDSATLTYNTPIQIPATGITTLRFSQWYFNEDDDRGFVEVSTNGGTSWTPIYTNARSMGDLPDTGADAFANEGLTPQELDLTIYSGQTIRLRFRYFQGESDFFFFVQYGWYIDDISITNDSWLDLTSADVISFLVSGRSDGTRCYRARTTYPSSIPSPYSNVVTAVTDIVCTVQNIALGTAGSIASATSSHSSGLYPAGGAINGNHTGSDWNNGGGWNDGTRDAYPDTLEVNFGQSRTIDEISVYTLQNNWQNAAVEPTETTSASAEGILDFTVEYWNGSAWVNIASVTGNDKAMRVFQFPQVTTTKIRVVVTAARNNWSRIVEVEAKGCN